MKTAVRLAAVAAVAVWSSGCIAIDMLGKVKGDGSGTVEKSLSMNPQALNEMKQTMGAGAKGGKDDKDPTKMTDKELMSGPFDPEELKKEAAKMGPGVTFVSATPIREKDRRGARAVFAFKDVSTLKLNQKPMADAAGPGGGASKPEDELKFSLTKEPNGNRLFKVKSSGLGKAASTTKKTGSPSPEMDAMAKGMMDMMKAMMKGLRITIGMEVDGPIVKTNNQYVSGSRVTFL